MIINHSTNVFKDKIHIFEHLISCLVVISGHLPILGKGFGLAEEPQTGDMPLVGVPSYRQSHLLVEKLGS